MLNYYELLFLLYSFETLWAYFSLSDGKLYHDDCCDITGKFVARLRKLSEQDPAVLDRETLDLPDNLDPHGLIELFAAWDDQSCQGDFNLLLQNSYEIRLFTTGLKGYLYKRLKLSLPLAKPSDRELMFRESIIRWQAHFPNDYLLDMSKAAEMLDWASSTESIVVVGDIRRSQDLMTYARDSQSFTDYIFRFIERTRKHIHENLGIFDKFTGDGFLAYFNETLCALKGKDYKQCFLDFVRDEMAFAEQHFPEWCLTVRKVPEVSVGLCLGADVGLVNFQDVDSHLIAVGDSIIWANRMASAGHAGDVVLNNLLYAELKDRDDLEFVPVEAKTKAGETFRARFLRFKEQPAEPEAQAD